MENKLRVEAWVQYTYQVLRNLAIWTQNPELTLIHLLLKVLDHLVRPPGAVWLLFARTRPVTAEACECPAGDKKVHGNMLFVTQIVAQVLGNGFHSGFAGVVGRVAWGIGDALLRACDDDGCWGGGCGGFDGGEAVILLVGFWVDF